MGKNLIRVYNKTRGKNIKINIKKIKIIIKYFIFQF